MNQTISDSLRIKLVPQPKNVKIKAEFHIYECEGTAYILPLNWCACQVLHGFDEEYRDYRALRMSVAMLGHITQGLREDRFAIKMKKI